MDFIEKLVFNRLMKELDYIDSDLMYKTNVLKKADEDFLKNVNFVLTEFPKLKDIIEETNKIRQENIKIPITPPPMEHNPIDDLIITEEKPSKLKNLYRQIAKNTHPDKTKQDNLKEVYLDAQKAYESNDIISILSICERLKIEYEITKEEVELLKIEIQTKKQRIQFLESTYTWRWMTENSNDIKIKIILAYLEAQLIR